MGNCSANEVEPEYEPDGSVKVSKCNVPRCGVCRVNPPHLEEGNSFRIKNFLQGRDEHIYINGNMSCDSSNIIYAIRCVSCERCYIGETGKSLKKRMAEHRSERMYVDEHLRACGNNYKVMPIIQLNKDVDEKVRKKVELLYIQAYYPELNDDHNPYFCDILPSNVPFWQAFKKYGTQPPRSPGSISVRRPLY